MNFDGWAHDKCNSQYMLLFEAAAVMLFVFIVVIVLKILMNKKLIPATIK